MVHLSSLTLHSVLTGLCLWQIIKNSIDYYNTRTTIVTTTGLADVDQVSLAVSALPPRTGCAVPCRVPAGGGPGVPAGGALALRLRQLLRVRVRS